MKPVTRTLVAGTLLLALVLVGWGCQAKSKTDAAKPQSNASQPETNTAEPQKAEETTTPPAATQPGDQPNAGEPAEGTTGTKQVSDLIGKWHYTGFAVKPDGTRYPVESGPLHYSTEWPVEFRADGTFVDASGGWWGWSPGADGQIKMHSDLGEVTWNYRFQGENLLMLETTKPGTDMPELERVK